MEAPAATTFASATTLVGTQLPSPTVTGLGAFVSANTMSSPNSPQNGECQLLGPFSLLIQAALGGLALLSLVYKRYRERPQRPLKIWAFDVSKQVFGSVMLHLANLVLSMFSAGHFEIRQQYQPNPCSFYLLNLGIDTTLGIPILYLALRIINRLAHYTPLARPPESIESGNYGQPPRIMWWLKQSILYFIGLLWMKLCVFVLIQVFPVIVKIGDWALRWTEGNTALQIIFVMLLFPLIMNAIQYYIVDTFIKRKVVADIDMEPFEDEHRNELSNDNRDSHGALLEAGSQSDDESDLEDGIAVRDIKPLSRAGSDVRVATTEYDPAVDCSDLLTESSSKTSIPKGPSRS
ncbi:conserved hypothetical protein [Talaromyces stipitatus ATCC 10500]|uniref:Vacuolar membrane protein n=1 Tax=Talaromyces stipitatus (strain ATCC 10500 / CBS 375.48 / QM 6759 / NRRL 1006) TaxID=441959 RepID=B8LT64_TALSN|nr:uncharacterized protein TSTA_069860 [Talaromyces stipitatus ATCC 10500]EED23572.1 conserved hypothetical protein [Talaromyces stipitatus ATCC 10500]